MRARLAAAAAGALLIAAVLVVFALSSNPVVAGDSSVEPIRPSVFVSAGTQQCQPLSRVPRGADRIRVLVTYVTGGARDLHVEISDPRGRVTAGDLKPATSGERLIELHPRTPAAHRASLCFTNPGQGQIIVGGDLKRIRGAARGPQAQKQNVASVVFLRPGSSSWFAQTDTIADRYANSQTGIAGRWSLWLAVLFAVTAALIGLWSVALPERSS
ncbi:MAG: hypothetical protein ACJ75Z_06450 [Solirubrobacterales bacterium]